MQRETLERLYWQKETLAQASIASTSVNFMMHATACAGSAGERTNGRGIQKLGHTVRLMASQYVKAENRPAISSLECPWQCEKRRTSRRIMTVCNGSTNEAARAVEG